MKFRIPEANEPVPVEYLRILDDMDRLAVQLDARFNLPLANVRFGWDPILGLIPVAGDLASLALAVRIIAAARTLGAPAPVVRRMAYNVVLDTTVGAIPLAGTVFDIFFRANLRNIQLLMDEIRRKRHAAVSSPARGAAP